MITRQRTSYSAFLILLLVMWGILTLRLDALWFGHHDENGRWVSTAARNYVVYGAHYLNYLETVIPHPTPLDEQEFYVNHPPLIVWAVSLASDLFGRYGEDSLFLAGSPYESSARLVPIMATLLSLCAFFVMVRRLFGLPIAWIALVLYCFTPMTMYFGRMVNHEPLALLWLYLFGAIFVNWMRRTTYPRTVALIICGGLAMWTAWASAFILFTLGLVALIFGRRQQRVGILIIGVIIALITIMLGVYYVLAYPATIATLQEAFLFRTSNTSFSRGSESFTLIQFITRQLGHSLTMMSFAVVILGIVGIVLSLRQRITFATGVMLAWVLGAFLYMLVFRNAFYIHDYYKIYFMAGFSSAAALAIRAAWDARRRGITRYARPLVFSITIVSWVAGFWWLLLLHQSGMSAFPRDVVTSLATYPAENDVILTNLSESTPVYEYYAYRKIIKQQLPEDALEAENPDGDVWYLLCSSAEQNVVNDYNGLMSDYDFISVADSCRLINVTANTTTANP